MKSNHFRLKDNLLFSCEKAEYCLLFFWVRLEDKIEFLEFLIEGRKLSGKISIESPNEDKILDLTLSGLYCWFLLRI